VALGAHGEEPEPGLRAGRREAEGRRGGQERHQARARGELQLRDVGDTRYAKVLDAEGKSLTVREALALINQTLDEALAEQEGDFDADSRWAITWFEESGFAEGDFGRAEQLSKSKNTSVDGMKRAGIVASARGKVRLLRPDELPADGDPVTDLRVTAWETVHQLIRVLGQGGEGAAAELVSKLGAGAEVARELAYRLYTLLRTQEAGPRGSVLQRIGAKLARDRATGQGGLAARQA
jgi:adenine-specific DNA methylase